MTTTQTEGRPIHQGLQESSEHGQTQLSSIPGQSVSTPPACTGLPDVRSPARLSSRNPLAQARNRNLTSSGPQDWGPETNHSTHLGPSFLSSRTTPLPPRLESPQLQLAFPSSPEKPLPTLIQAQICLKFTPQTTQTPRQPIFFANPPVTPARFRVGPLLESFFNTELRFLHNPG